VKLILFVVLLPIAYVAVGAQSSAMSGSAREPVDLAVVARIKEEAFAHSQIAEMAGYLTDVIGPRLTGSPALRRAHDWTADKLRGWNVTDVTLEPWGEFGRGWDTQSAFARVLSPYPQTIDVSPVAWTPGTSGRVTGPVVAIQANTAAEVTAMYSGKLARVWVMDSPPNHVPMGDDAAIARFTLEELLGPPKPQAPEAIADQAKRMAEGQARFKRRQAIGPTLRALIRQEGAYGLLDAFSLPYGSRGQYGIAGAMLPDAPPAITTLTLGLEQYGQVWRNVVRGIPVMLEAEVQNTFYDTDLTAYNTFGSIRGKESPDEYVMIGAHLDSWHGGTGAADNGAGVVVMLEAMRILRTLGIQPRRTIRVALWSGEEQGLAGSAGWLKKHPELHARISAYLNLDEGTGRIRGIRTQGNDSAAGILEEILSPFRDLGVVAVQRSPRIGGSDHSSFNAVGVPGFNFVQDLLDYWNHAHHTNVDRYERLVIDDLQQAAAVVAATALTLANRQEMLPRPAVTGRGR
jgi:carboxypeptidase Q